MYGTGRGAFLIISEGVGSEKNPRSMVGSDGKRWVLNIALWRVALWRDVPESELEAGERV